MSESSTPMAPAAYRYPGHGANAGIGVAICHGFTGSPLSVLPWAEHLAALGHAVTVPLLPGHGTDWRDLARHRWQDWYQAFESAYLDLAARTESSRDPSRSRSSARDVGGTTASVSDLNTRAGTSTAGSSRSVALNSLRSSCTADNGVSE